MGDRERYLAAYDARLRTEAETAGALRVERVGPLHLAAFRQGRGFVTYRDLDGAGAKEVDELVAAAVAHFEADPDVVEVEWKTRGHDVAPGLPESLRRRGFVPEEPESVMIGEAQALAVDVPLPDGVVVRRIDAPDDVRAMCATTAEVFGDPPEDVEAMAASLLRRLALDLGIELWVAEAEGRVVSAGRLEPVAGTDVAGIWGGATLRAWRGRGIYRALTAERARSALRLGKRYVHSDSTEHSRPILERYGFLRVTTTTPYTWRR